MLRVSTTVLRSPATTHEIHVLCKRAREVLLVNGLTSIRPISRDAYRVVSISVSRGYWKGDGFALALIRRDYDAVHYGYVSKDGVKCSCIYSVRKAARADNALKAVGMPEVASRYALCKHTLAALAKLVALGELSLRDERFRRTLVRCTLITYLFVEPIDRIRSASQVIKRILLDV